MHIKDDEDNQTVAYEEVQFILKAIRVGVPGQEMVTLAVEKIIPQHKEVGGEPGIH